MARIGEVTSCWKEEYSLKLYRQYWVMILFKLPWTDMFMSVMRVNAETVGNKGVEKINETWNSRFA